MFLYLDNAATSYPKPPGVIEAVRRALEGIAASPGRGAHRHGRYAAAVAAECRARVAGILGVSDAGRVVFTKNATEGLNLVLKGWLRPGDRVLYTGFEHNSVVRPLRRLVSQGVRAEQIPCTPGGGLDLPALREMLAAPARLVVLVHASNVNGALMPVAEVSELCGRSGVPVLLDAAQTAGLLPIAAEELNLGMVACSGHKGLLGPSGMGLLYVRPDLDVSPLMEGGTGSRSEVPEQPEECPDRYESGTPNLPGMAGLAEGIGYILEQGMEAIWEHEVSLALHLESELSEMPGVRVLIPEERGTGTVSFTVDGMNPADLGFILDEAFDIAVRTGLHCAPLAHQSLGTFPEGTVRVSPGFSTSSEEIESFLEALRSVLARR
ncbi:MAG: aminotransferase class V-fold PLP-dependent enzyme [Desulfobacteraceae bacterium]|nr:aminotransferase class V-fold PLP-dependent enzyme [Desulfobacteraceae bacterium]